MGFEQSLSRELGKNTGKWISNKVFGDSYATPTKLIIQRERDAKRKERDEALLYKLREKQIEQERRENVRELRQLEKELAERERQELIQTNEEEVREHDNYIRVIQSVHKDYSNKVDWKAIISQPLPERVESASDDAIMKYYRDLTDRQVDEGIQKIKNRPQKSFVSYILSSYYEPRYEWLFKITESKIVLWVIYTISLLLLLRNAYLGLIVGGILVLVYWLLKNGSKDFAARQKQEDEILALEAKREIWYNEYISEHTDAFLGYMKATRQQKKLTDIAQRILRSDSSAYIEAIDFFNPFEDLKAYGSDVFYRNEANRFVVDFFAKQEDVIPRVTKRLLRKGLEVKEEPMSNARFSEIYQDYVCSCLLRIAKEVFAFLPIDDVQINIKSVILNSGTGINEDKTIVSALVKQDVISRLNYDLLDPSDSMVNFVCNMNFKRGEGFSPVEELRVN